MQPFTVLTAVAAPLEIAKIDTGMILPGRYMRRHRRPGHDYGEAFLRCLRWFRLILVGLRLRFRSAGRCPAVHAGNIDRRSSVMRPDGATGHPGN